MLALLLALLASPSHGQGLLEHVQGKVGQAWLLGSLHFGSDDLYPLGERVERAFAACNRIMVEVNLQDLDAEQVQELVRRYGAYPKGDVLRHHVSEHLWQRLVAAGSDLGLGARSLERLRPWLAALNLTAAFLARHGLTPAQGVDQYFMRRARRARLPILELENFAGQIHLLHGLPTADQVLMLDDTLSQVEAGRSLPNEMLTAWRVGDREALQRLLLGRLAGSGQGRRLMRRLLDERNEPMAKRVAEEVARGGNVFVVVGAAHLLGPQSLSVHLKALGLKVSSR